MHPADIVSSVKKVGSSISAIGRELGVSHVSVSRVVSGQGRSERIEQRIAEITDIPLYRLWPQWHEAPEGAPKEFDVTKLNVDLLESVERHLAAELMRRVPGLTPPFVVRARHRVAVYNACVARGTVAIETGAGTADEVAHFLAHWAENYEQTTGDKPTPEALRKWALADHDMAASTTTARASVTTVQASGGSIASGRDTVVGRRPPTKQ